MSKKKFFVLALALLLLVGLVMVVHQRRAAENNSDATADQNNTSNSPLEVAAVGLHDYTLQSGGHERSYTVYVPTDYDPKQSYPLVFLLHGGDGNGTSFISKGRDDEPASKRFLGETNFADKAEAEGFIVVAPEGYKGDWNDGRPSNESAVDGIDDVAFIVSLISEVDKAYQIDTKRVYSVGISNGGLMSYRLACERPDVFAAVSGVSASMVKTVGETCTASVPIVGIQGTADPLMKFDGSPSKYAKVMGSDPNAPSPMMAAMDNMNLWARNNGCETTPTITRLPVIKNDDTTVDKYSFKECDSERAVEYYVVNGMGHTWPPGHRAVLSAIAGPSSGNIVTNDVVWEFFSAHSK